MEITINGESVEVTHESLDSVLVELGYDCKRVVIAVNDTFVPRNRWSIHEVVYADRIEVLAAIEGG